MTAQKHAWHVQKDTSIHDTALIGDVMTESELWACTTCRSCEEQCPVGNEHVDKIIDMRRYLVLTEGRLPAEGQRALQNIERQGNPWGLPRAERAAWISAYETSTAGYRSDGQAKPIRTVQEADAKARNRSCCCGQERWGRMTSEAGASCLRWFDCFSRRACRSPF